MQRRLTWLSAALASVLVLAACSGSSTGETATTEGPLVATTATTAPVQPPTTTTTIPPTTTTTEAPAAAVFQTIAGTPPHELTAYNARLSIALTLPDSTIGLEGAGVFTDDAFSCDWTVTVLGEATSQKVLGSPDLLWLGEAGQVVVPSNSADAQGTHALCPSSPGFWAAYGASIEGEPSAEVKNDITTNRYDITKSFDGIPGATFSQLPGVSVESAAVWVADPGGWVSSIEFVMTVSSEAATSMWGIPFDPDANPTEMVYRVDVLDPDDPSLAVSLPEAVDFGVGFGSVTVTGEPLPTHDPGGLDSSLYSVAPTVVGADWEGNELTIGADGRSKIVVFLAHWCPHCQNEVPIIQDWLDAGKLPPEVDIYSASVMTDHNRANWPPQEWLESEGWTVPVLMDDEASSVAFAYGVNSVPFFMVLDGENRNLMRIAGGLDERALDILVQIALEG